MLQNKFFENQENEKIRILLVDDNEKILGLVKLYLESSKNNMEVSCFEDVLEAIDLLKEQRFDIIVSDYMMPNMNGLDFFKKIKENGSSSPFILLTGIASEENSKVIIEAVNIGIDGYISKEGNVIDRFEELAQKIKKTFSEHKIKNQYKSIFENSPIGIFRLTKQGKFISANPMIAKIMGYPDPGDLIDQEIRPIFVNPQEYEKILEKLSVQNDWINYGEVFFLQKNGAIISVDLKIRNVQNSISEVIYLEGFIQDITDLKKSEESLRQTNQRLNLMANISQNNISKQLINIIGCLGIAQMKFSNPEIKDLIQKIQSSAHLIVSQIKFEDFYQSLGRQEPKWQKLEEIIPILSDSKIILNVDLPKILIFADPMLSKIFQGLCDNSMRHGKKISQVKISAIPTELGLMIVWEDDGVGISDQYKESIFSRKEEFGSELGLFLIREILAITGIKIQETGEFQKGARFEILVPKEKYKISED